MDGGETLSAQAIGGKGSRQAPEVAIDDGLVDDPSSSSGVPCRDDVYMRNGVWVELRARPFGRVVRG